MLLGKILDLFKPVGKLVDDIHTSDEERLTLKAKLVELEAEAMKVALDYEKAALQVQQAAIVAEASGNSWLQRNWRPITMIVFLCLVVLDSLGLLHAPLPPQAWSLLQLGLGGYVIGRSAEKVGVSVVNSLKAKESI